MRQFNAGDRAAPHDDALSALLATEHALHARLAAATAEAQRIVTEARSHVNTVERGLEIEVVREIAGLDAARERALRDEISAIAARSLADAARFDNVSEERIRDLAARVVAHALSG